MAVFLAPLASASSQPLPGVATTPPPPHSLRGPRRWIGALLWVLAIVLMLSTAVYQRLTGPTHPARGTITLSEIDHDYKLIRSENTGTDAVVELPMLPADVDGVLRYKRYKTADDWTDVALLRSDDGMSAALPTQPPAGKLEYHLFLDTPGGQLSVPSDETVVIRYKGAVPTSVLLPHVLCMFFAMLIGLRTMLEVVTGRPGVRWMSWATLGLVGLGGMTLGPIVQLYAFGEAWTGVPFGWDLTDNKTLVMFVGWLVAVSFVGWKGEVSLRARWAAALAATLMIGVYMVPHSAMGSELDYEQVDQGVDPGEAIKTG